MEKGGGVEGGTGDREIGVEVGGTWGGGVGSNGEGEKCVGLFGRV